jgi:hypothetical protein
MEQLAWLAHTLNLPILLLEAAELTVATAHEIMVICVCASSPALRFPRHPQTADVYSPSDKKEIHLPQPPSHIADHSKKQRKYHKVTTI